MADHGHGSRVRLELCSRARSSVKQQRNTIVLISLVNLEDLTLHRTGLAGIPLLPGLPTAAESGHIRIHDLYVMDFFTAGVTLLRKPRAETGHGCRAPRTHRWRGRGS